MSQYDYQLYYERNLPHYQPPGATLFITFRLAGSLPKAVLQRLLAERELLQTQLSTIVDPAERATAADRLQRILFGKWDHALDTQKTGPRWLHEPNVASLVCDSLHFLDDHPRHRKYSLHAFCVMPNHVHLVCTPLPKSLEMYHSLASIMHSLKGYTAHKANLELGRKGHFWQSESFDHVVRDSGELERIIAYVLENPVKAGLVSKSEDWTWIFPR